MLAQHLGVTAVEVGPSPNKPTKVFSVEGNGEIFLDPRIFTNRTSECLYKQLSPECHCILLARVGGVLYYNLSDFLADFTDKNGS